MPGSPTPAAAPPGSAHPPDTFAAASALSRFEFETGRGNEGTKILLVEWDTHAHAPDGAGAGAVLDDATAHEATPREATPRDPADDRRADLAHNHWHISWDAKPAGVLAVRDTDPEHDTDGRTRRVLYLLPPHAPVPALVTIARAPSPNPGPGPAARSPERGSLSLTAKPMPAIFPAELTSDAAAGRRGVLHMLWARKRLAALQSEIEAEMRENGESVGLEMALQERQWIQDHFVLHGRGPVWSDGAIQQQRQPSFAPNRPRSPPTSPTSPKSPVGNRLGEKLRGLKLATSPADLAGGLQTVGKPAFKTQSLVTILTPDTSGVTVPASLHPFGGSIPPKKASLDAMVTGGGPQASHSSSNEEDELFALPMSPRSPEMERSPFSLL